MKITVLPNQTLSDIAIQEYGVEEAVFLLAYVNNISPTATLSPGMALQRPDQIFNKEMQVYCKNNHVSPATAEISDDDMRLHIFTKK